MRQFINYLFILLMRITKEQSDQLQRVTGEKLRKMFDDKKQTPKLLIPKHLPSFVKSKTYLNFLDSVFLYCSNFNEVLKQYNILKQKMQSRVGDDTSLLRKQKQQLAKLEREVSYNYAAIIIAFNTQCMEEDKKRSNFKDQVFFEALIYLIERVIKQFFSREEFSLIQEEINRLFRTNRYNLIKKRHKNDQILHKYPALKEQNSKNKNNLMSILNKAPDRISAFRKYEKEKRNNSTFDYTSTLGIPKQLSNADMEQRSPLICTWLPSRKSMLQDFSQSSSYSNYIQSNEKKSTFNTISQGSEGRSRIASIGHHAIKNTEV